MSIREQKRADGVLHDLRKVAPRANPQNGRSGGGTDHDCEHRSTCVHVGGLLGWVSLSCRQCEYFAGRETASALPPTAPKVVPAEKKQGGGAISDVGDVYYVVEAARARPVDRRELDELLRVAGQDGRPVLVFGSAPLEWRLEVRLSGRPKGSVRRAPAAQGCNSGLAAIVLEELERAPAVTGQLRLRTGLEAQQVYSALQHLRRRGLVVSSGHRGAWRIAPQVGSEDPGKNRAKAVPNVSSSTPNYAESLRANTRGV